MAAGSRVSAKMANGASRWRRRKWGQRGRVALVATDGAGNMVAERVG
jgi:hypothetical protein